MMTVSTDMNKLLTIIVPTAFMPIGKPMLNFSQSYKSIVQNSIALLRLLSLKQFSDA